MTTKGFNIGVAMPPSSIGLNGTRKGRNPMPPGFGLGTAPKPVMPYFSKPEKLSTASKWASDWFHMEKKLKKEDEWEETVLRDSGNIAIPKIPKYQTVRDVYLFNSPNAKQMGFTGTNSSFGNSGPGGGPPPQDSFPRGPPPPGGGGGGGGGGFLNMKIEPKEDKSAKDIAYINPLNGVLGLTNSSRVTDMGNNMTSAQTGGDFTMAEAGPLPEMIPNAVHNIMNTARTIPAQLSRSRVQKTKQKGKGKVITQPMGINGMLAQAAKDSSNLYDVPVDTTARVKTELPETVLSNPIQALPQVQGNVNSVPMLTATKDSHKLLSAQYMERNQRIPPFSFDLGGLPVPGARKAKRKGEGVSPPGKFRRIGSLPDSAPLSALSRREAAQTVIPTVTGNIRTMNGKTATRTSGVTSISGQLIPQSQSVPKFSMNIPEILLPNQNKGIKRGRNDAGFFPQKERRTDNRDIPLTPSMESVLGKRPGGEPSIYEQPRNKMRKVRQETLKRKLADISGNILERPTVPIAKRQRMQTGVAPRGDIVEVVVPPRKKGTKAVVEQTARAPTGSFIGVEIPVKPRKTAVARVPRGDIVTVEVPPRPSRKGKEKDVVVSPVARKPAGTFAGVEIPLTNHLAGKKKAGNPPPLSKVLDEPIASRTRSKKRENAPVASRTRAKKK